MYVCIYHICIALISCSMHVHKRFNNIVSKNCEEKGGDHVIMCFDTVSWKVSVC